MEQKNKRISVGRICGLTALVLILIFAVVFAVSEMTTGDKSDGTQKTNGKMFFSLPADSVISMSAFNKDGLVVLTDTAVKYYDNFGNQLGANECTYTNPVMKTAGKNVIVFDRGGYSLRVEKNVESFINLTFESIITNCAISENGDYAYVLNSNEGYQSHLYVYNFRGAKEFEWGGASEYITDLAISDSGKYICVALIGTNNAEYFSRIILFNKNSDKPVYSVDLPETAVYSVAFVRGKKTVVYSDNGVYYIESAEEVIPLQEYSSEEMNLSVNNSYSLGATVINKFGNEKNVLFTGFSKNYKVQSTREYEDTVKFLSVSDNYYAIAFDKKIEILNSENSVLNDIELNDNCLGCTVSGRNVFVLFADGIQKYHVTD